MNIKERIKLIDQWVDKMPRTTYLFTQMIEGGAVFIAAAMGIALEHWWPLGILWGIVPLAAIGIVLILVAFWWLSNQLIKERWHP